ncbi:MAG TPA: hypothetical protein GXX23_01305 [Firmicutes bacterium]|nr:hypothetical protein [Candidatus Fermentithermobacillaceae bacterium]
MAFILSISGSTVRSESKRLPELFQWHTQGMEVGDFASTRDLDYIVSKCKKCSVKLGLHTPLLRTDDRHGLLWDSSTTAWDELRRNLEFARDHEIAYVLVHFPYIWDKGGRNLGVEGVRSAVHRLKRLEEWSGVPIVCEPKLGPNRDPSVFMLLWSIGKQELRQWDISFALDVGDIYLASQKLRGRWEPLFSHLAPWCSVIHLHNVWAGGRQYYWTPVSPRGNVPVDKMMAYLDSENKDIYAVLQHNPHRSGGREEVGEGINWLLQNAGPWKDREGYDTWDGKYTRVK